MRRNFRKLGNLVNPEIAEVYLGRDGCRGRGAQFQNDISLLDESSWIHLRAHQNSIPLLAVTYVVTLLIVMEGDSRIG